MRAPPPLKYALVGLGAGVGVSILFFPLNFLVGFVLLVFLLVRVVGCVPGGRVNYIIAGGVAFATITVAVVAPVKHLDGRVGPFSYGRMSLDELCQTLGRDHRVFVSAGRWIGTNVMNSFVTEREMSRRKVLEKLAREANGELHIGYCGTGATFLFGAHPSFTRLYARDVQPSSPANGSQPVGY